MPDAEAAAEPRDGRAPTETTNNARAVFETATRTTGIGALKIALTVASALLDGKETEELQTIFLEEISALKQATSHERPNGDALEIAREAMRRGISWSAVEGSNLLRLGSGRFAHVLAGSETTLTTRMAHRLTQSKAVTADILNAAGLPIPRQRFVRTEEEALDAVRVVGLPLMVKPATGSKGRAVSAGIIDEADVLPALHRALAVSPEAIIEAFVPGEEYRLLIVGGRFAAAARRRPAQVRGDGASSVRTLVEKENARPERNQRLSGRTKSLVPLALDEEALALLAEQGLSPEAVPSEGHAVLLRRQASHASGGDTVDVTDIVHHTIQKMAGRAAALFGIDVCGVDFVTTDITRPCEEFGGAICDITTRPSLRLHYDVAQGKARNVAGNILDMLFPRDAPSRCPVVVLVGTNKETTEIRQTVERAAAQAGRTLGIIIGPEGAENLAPTTRRLKNLRAVGWDKEVEAILVQASAAEVAERGLGLERINLAVLPEKDGDPTLGAARSALARLSGNRVLQPDDPAARRRVLAALGLSKSARTGEKKVRPEPARSLDKAKAHPAPLSVAAANVTATLPPTGDRLKAKSASPVFLMAGDIGFGDLETRLGKPDFSRLRALEMRLGKPDFARWRARTGGWIRPAPLDKADAAAYAVHRLQASQYNYSAGLQFFDEAGLAALYALSKGVPRMIDHVMECCLLEAQASGRTSFDGEFVQACTTREGQVSHLCTGLGAFSAMPDATPVPVSPPIGATKKPVYAALGHNKPDVPVIGHARTLRMSVAAMLAGILVLFPGHHARSGRMSTVISGNPPIVPEQAGSFLSRRVTPEQAPVAESLLAEGLANESTEPEYAARLYVRAALWGNDRAAYYLGQLYETGFGVERDLQRAHAWYNAAAGIAGAADRLAEMATLPSQVESASAPIPVLQRLIEPDKTELHWQGPAGAGQFRVEFIPAGGEGQARHLDTALSAVLILQPVQAWRVMALDGNGVTGPASAWSRLDPGAR